jgi:hypothetical protein
MMISQVPTPSSSKSRSSAKSQVTGGARTVHLRARDRGGETTPPGGQAQGQAVATLCSTGASRCRHANEWRRRLGCGSQVDDDGTGGIEFGEFLKLILNQKTQAAERADEKDTIDAFVAMGGCADKSGVIQTEKLVRVIEVRGCWCDGPSCC